MSSAAHRTAVGTHTYTNDILGNRLTWNPGSGNRTHTWDCLNRMVSRFSSPKTTNFTYRADGMRTGKVTTWTGNTETFRYFYDGQMPMEDTYKLNSTATVVNRYGLGARGLDFMESGGNVSYPVYDGHGNMVATLARNGLGYTVGNRRSFDPWGKVRTGAATGDPSGRYCANLGHKMDDDSGYIYMRARYYEPGTGRFISQDPARDGLNWFAYCDNAPVEKVDPSGKLSEGETWGALVLGSLLSLFTGWVLFVGVVPQFEAQMESALYHISKARAFLSLGSLMSQADVNRALSQIRSMQSTASANRAGMSLAKAIGYLLLVSGVVLAGMVYDYTDGQIDTFELFAKVHGWI